MSWVEALLALPGVGLGIANAVETHRVNDLNYKAQQEAFQWEKDQYNTMLGREDNAVQRRVADLKAAGLSPVLAAGSAASSSSPIHLNAPEAKGGVSAALQGGITQAMNLLQGQKNIAQTNAQIAAIKEQAEKTRFENIMLSRERDVLANMQLIKAENGGEGGTAMDEALRRITQRNAETAKSMSEAREAASRASAADWDLSKAMQRNIKTGSTSTSDMADLYEYLKGTNGAGAEAAMLNILLNMTNGVAGAAGKAVVK